MRKHGTTLLIFAAAAALVAPTIPAHAAETIDLGRPGSVERGDDIRIPHLAGSTVVDGDRRIEVPGAVTLMGTSGDDYVVQTRTDRRARYRVVRVATDGGRRVVLRGKQALRTQLSGDGEHLIGTERGRHARITAYDAVDGAEVSSRRFRGHAEVVAADRGTVLVTSWGRDYTDSWDLATDTRERIAHRVGYVADISADRLALYTGDPYLGGCSRVVAVSDPSRGLWRSCRQKVLTFSPDGTRVVSTGILVDGVGPNEVWLREADGSVLTRYRANWFGSLQWEDAEDLLLDANGRRKGATIRCNGSDCVRASDLRDSSP